MTKRELVKEVAKGAGISQAEASKAIDSMTANIQKSRKKGVYP